MSVSLTRSEISRYQDRGFLGPFTLCPPAEMATTRHYIEDKVLTREGALEGHRAYVRHQDDRRVYDLCAHPTVVNRLMDLFGPDIVLWVSSFWVKKPGDPVVPWHQDVHYWTMEPPLTLTAWIAVSASTKDNGCLQFVPGSHHEYLPHVPTTEGELFAEKADADHIDEEKAVPIELVPGQFVLFSDRVLHRSGPNGTGQPRIGLGARYTLPFVKLFHDRVPLFPGHRAYVVAGQDRFGFNRLGEPPEPQPDPGQ